MVEGPIPWTAIHQYAAAHGVHHPDEVDRLSALVKRMDMVYLSHVQQKVKSKTGPSLKDLSSAKVQRVDDGAMHMR